VNVRLLIATQSGATVVPQAAIQRGSAGPFVYAVVGDATVSVKQVLLGPEDGPNVSVEHGLAPGAVVVVSGADRLREGARVQVRRAGPGETSE
jgi:membrane fusion protein, multidrug efflux system